MKYTKKLTFLALCTTVALVLSYLEALLPPIWSAVPGIKMGFPNIIIVFLLYRLSLREAAAVSFIRVSIVALLFGTGMTFIYSISGAVLSLIVMALLKKINLFSVVGVSIAGGVAHNLGQIIAAIFLLKTAEIGYYMIVLAFTGTVAGVFVGLAGGYLTKRFENIRI